MTGGWGPDGRAGAVCLSFDNLGEAADLELGTWPEGKRVGAHPSIHETLPFLLSTLADQGLRATFFVEGWNVEHYPDAVRAIAEAGHEIGAHAYRHEMWFTLTAGQQRDNLRRTDALFRSIGVKPVGFRPPGGISTVEGEAELAALGYIYTSPLGGEAGARNGLAVVPSDMAGTDVTYYSEAFAKLRQPGAAGATEGELFVSGFKLLLDDIAAAGACRSTVCHMTTPLDTQDRRDAIRQVIALAAGDDRLWKPTLAEAAQWMLDHPAQLPVPLLRGTGPDWDPASLRDDAAGVLTQAFRKTPAETGSRHDCR